MGYRVATPPISSRRQDGKQQKSTQKQYVSKHGNMQVVVDRRETHAESSKYVRSATVHELTTTRRVTDQPQRTMTVVSSAAIKWRQRTIVAVRMIFGCWWGLDAWLKCQTAFISRFTTYLATSLHPHASIVTLWFAFWLQIAHVQPHFFADSVVALEFCIAGCLLLGICNTGTCGTGICLALSGWSVIDGMGGLWGRNSIDSGIIVVYVLIFLGLIMGKAGKKWGVALFMADTGRFQKKPVASPVRPYQHSRDTRA